jgi:vanillate O-demethylase ferredoxin subunit
MIDAAIQAASRLGWPKSRLRFEIFSNTVSREDDAFEVVLQNSGQVFVIPPDRTILDVLLEAGVDPIFDRRGDCGLCQVGVIEGIPDHRDYILSEHERSGNKIMQICISRAKTPRLILVL